MPNKHKPIVQSVERAIDILQSFTADEPGLGVVELSRRVGLPKSTVFRLLSTMEARGFITQNSDTNLYQLGVELIPLANSVFIYGNLRQVARPHLHNLADTLEETTILSVLVDAEIINLDQVEFTGRLVVRAGRAGHRMPFHATSAGKVIAAFLPKDELDVLLASPLPVLTSATITESDTLRSQLVQVRTRGYAVSFEELEEGLHAISAPIRNHGGNVVACLSVSGPSYRLTRSRVKETSPHVILTADRISRELRHTQEF
jgi:DNA-binding IclR family transcriptional regulator